MEVNILLINQPAILTTEHSASSYGRPVLLVDGVAYGPADKLPTGAYAGAVVVRLEGSRPTVSILARETAIAFGDDPSLTQAHALIDAWHNVCDTTPGPHREY